MILENINLGSAVNAGDGDKLYTAFTKINQNFANITSNVNGLTNSVSSVAGRTGNVTLTTQDIIGLSDFAPNIAGLQANAAVQSGLLVGLEANAAVQSGLITTINGNISALTSNVATFSNIGNIAVLQSSIGTKYAAIPVDVNGDAIIHVIPRTGTIANLSMLTSGGIGELAVSPTEKAIVLLNGTGAASVFKEDMHVYVRALTDTGTVAASYDMYVQPFGVSTFSIIGGNDGQIYYYKEYTSATEYIIKEHKYVNTYGFTIIGEHTYSTTFDLFNYYAINRGKLATTNSAAGGRAITTEPGFKNFGFENIPSRFGTTIGDYAIGYTDNEISFGTFRGMGQQTRDGKVGMYAFTDGAIPVDLMSDLIDPVTPELVVNKRVPTLLYIEITVKDEVAFTWMVMKRSWIVGSTGNDGTTLVQLQSPTTIGTDYVGISGVTAGVIAFTVDNTNSIARITLSGVADKTLSATAYVEVRTLGF